jgi:hypothetical protein
MMDTSFLSMRIPKILMSTADEYGNVCRLMSKADEEGNGALTLTHTEGKAMELHFLTLYV